jgi:hypothetical protein
MVGGSESKFNLQIAATNKQLKKNIKMSKEILTANDVSELRRSIKQSETKIANSAREFASVPQSGTFVDIISKTFVIDGVERQSIGLLTDKGDFVSESCLQRSDIIDEPVKIKNGARKGKFMLRMKRLNDLSKFGRSNDAQLVGLKGKAFTTKKTDITQYKREFLKDATAFDAVCKTTEAALKAVFKNSTEIGTGYIFDITEVPTE